MGRRLGDCGTLFERLLEKVIVDTVTDCWNFTGGKNNIGYGMIRDGKKMRTAHRVSYEEHNNTVIPKHLVVMHSCDNPCCVSPHHLSLGTRKQNTHDMMSKGRHKYFGGNCATSGMKGKIMPRTTCVHCNRSISNPAYARSHGNNCRQKQVV